MHRARLAVLIAVCCLTTILADDISERAHKLHFSSIVLDSHDDTTQRFFSKDFDLGKQNPTGHVDIPRMREGGMNAIFFSIWIDGRIMGPRPPCKKSSRSDRRRAGERRRSTRTKWCLPALPRTCGGLIRKAKSPRSWAWKGDT